MASDTRKSRKTKRQSQRNSISGGRRNFAGDLGKSLRGNYEEPFRFGSEEQSSSQKFLVRLNACSLGCQACPILLWDKLKGLISCCRRRDDTSETEKEPPARAADWWTGGSDPRLEPKELKDVEPYQSSSESESDKRSDGLSSRGDDGTEEAEEEEAKEEDPDVEPDGAKPPKKSESDAAKPKKDRSALAKQILNQVDEDSHSVVVGSAAASTTATPSSQAKLKGRSSVKAPPAAKDPFADSDDDNTAGIGKATSGVVLPGSKAKPKTNGAAEDKSKKAPAGFDPFADSDDESKAKQASIEQAKPTTVGKSKDQGKKTSLKKDPFADSGDEAPAAGQPAKPTSAPKATVLGKQPAPATAEKDPFADTDSEDGGPLITNSGSKDPSLKKSTTAGSAVTPSKKEKKEKKEKKPKKEDKGKRIGKSLVAVQDSEGEDNMF